MSFEIGKFFEDEKGNIYFIREIIESGRSRTTKLNNKFEIGLGQILCHTPGGRYVNKDYIREKFLKRANELIEGFFQITKSEVR